MPKPARFRKRLLAARLVGGLLVASGSVGFQTFDRHDTEDDVRQAAAAMLHALPEYAYAPATYEALLAQAHPVAFAQTYRYDGWPARRFDTAHYLETLFTTMQQTARADGHARVAQTLTLRYALARPTLDV